MYLLIALVVLLFQIVLAAKMNKRNNYKLLPKKTEDRIPGIIMMMVIALAWIITVPLALVAFIGYIIIQGVLRLLERLEK